LAAIIAANISFAAESRTSWVEIDNVNPRLTESGSIVDAHDGRVVRFGDRFYWYGTSYGETNGFTTANRYRSYSSVDLKVWRDEGPLLEEQPEGVYYRPHVVRHPESGEYILWYNWYPELWRGRFGVAVSRSPSGPFRIVNDDVPVARSSEGVGDFGLFVDDDGTAYLSYNTIQGHQVSIERLAPDFRSSTLENGGVIARGVEAGAQFKHEGRYYLLTDHTCCFCNQGSGARVYVSEEPLSGYVLRGNINRWPGRAAPSLINGRVRGEVAEDLAGEEGSPPRTVELWLKEPTTVSALTIHFFTGGRPSNCGDVNNPRVHPPHKSPRVVVEVDTEAGWLEVEALDTEIGRSALVEQVKLSLVPTQGWRWRITPVAEEGVTSMMVTEVQFSDPRDPGSTALSADAVFVAGPGIPTPPIIPAQQTYVMELETVEGPLLVWMGDLWGSASDDVKGHDYQFWSEPLSFRRDGSIRPLRWADGWTARLTE
jgi:hypothetical protein